MSQTDCSSLDKPEALSFIFSPRRDVTPAPPNATDYSIPVDRDISIHCRLYAHSKSSPVILFFHGNGEVTSDYDYTAPLYNQAGINLLVADYRGYGTSQGKPTFNNMMSDASTIFEAFRDILDSSHYSGKILVMGRSLGSASAIEIAHHHPQRLAGLIIESGFASVTRLLPYLGFPATHLDIKDKDFPNLSKIRSITIPTLIIHGESDSLIPSSEGKALFEGAAARNKRLLIIPGANHSDIIVVGREQYLEAVREFATA